MPLIKGITVKLHEYTETSEDDFGQPIFSDVEVEVQNVLVGQPSTDDVVNDMNLYGKKLAYTLSIPKGDTHNWKDTVVEFFDQKFKTYGDVIQGIEENIPLCWNKQVKVEHYE